MDLVSIGMPVFNDKEFLRQALESLLNQTYSNFELIISDDCSTDGSEQICKEYEQKDSRIKYIRQEKNIGISNNMMFLLSQAKGKYFMWAGDDDLWEKDFIEILITEIQKTNSIMAFSLYNEIDNNNKVLRKIVVNYKHKLAFFRLLKLILKFNDAPGYGLFVRKEILDVKFPIWWYPNHTRAFNNIYPSLCFYLAKGHYSLYKEKVLWHKRMKEKVNHKVPFINSYFKSIIAFIIWKFNLFTKSVEMVYVAKKDILLTILISPFLFLFWFITPTIGVFFKRTILLVQGKLKNEK